MLMYKLNAQDEVLSAEIAITSIEVCPICGQPSWSKSTHLCLECFDRMLEENKHLDIDAWINREISIRLSFPKQFPTMS